MTRPVEQPINVARRKLQNPYAYLDSNGDLTASNVAQAIHVDEFRDPAIIGRPISHKTIEQIAKKLQIKLWKDGTISVNPLEILDPEEAFVSLGYQYKLTPGCGQYRSDGRTVEVAGYIDPSKMEVGISMQFPATIRNFTAAHELGHALLHSGRGMHRDRPLSRCTSSRTRPHEEYEADKFATYFLMPEKLVTKHFLDRFDSTNFTINDDTAFNLISKSQQSLRSACSKDFDLAKLLAKTDQYGRSRFIPIAELFNVSTEAMARRLVELGLVAR
jgi:Zn-dependent peptidase ImmA (M78 family)